MLGIIEGVVVGVGQLKALDMSLDDNWLGKPRPPPGQPGQLSLWLMDGKASSPRASERQDQLSTGPCKSAWPQMAVQTTGIYMVLGGNKSQGL